MKLYCRKCRYCSIAKPPQLKYQGPARMLLATKPYELLSHDFTKLERDNKGFQYKEVFSKFMVAVPTKDQKASTVAKFLLEKWIFYLGLPVKLHSDQGERFEAKIIYELCKVYGIHKTRTSSCHPAGNGVTERMNKTI